jgi:hypothetical protein
LGWLNDFVKELWDRSAISQPGKNARAPRDFQLYARSSFYFQTAAVDAVSEAIIRSRSGLVSAIVNNLEYIFMVFRLDLSSRLDHFWSA